MTRLRSRLLSTVSQRAVARGMAPMHARSIRNVIVMSGMDLGALNVSPTGAQHGKAKPQGR